MNYRLPKFSGKDRKVWVRPISPPLTSLSPITPSSIPSISGWDTCSEYDNSEYTSDLDSNPQNLPVAAFKYKRVSQKVRPVDMQIPEHQKPQQRFPEDPLRNLPFLPHHPPNFTPTKKITDERMMELGIDTHEELWPEE